MSNLSDRVAYLRGLAEGMEIGEESKLGKLVLAIIETLGETADAIQQLADDHEELDEYVESLDDDLAEIEEALFDDDDDDDDDDDEDDDDLIECECPACGNTIYFDAESFDLAEDHACPNCGKPLFDEVDAPDDEE
ncbi:MAG: hypothetical protein LBM74_03290 [Oscillospiraceae bacterium]|jgi:hypothetical protein|nr:hypothetical protein [Oscillospiraceae bacterium]